MIVLCAQGQVDKLSVVTYPLIRLARGARGVCTPRGVVASTTGGARCRTGNAVLIVVTTRVTLVVTAGGEVVSNHDELMSNFFAQPDALAVGVRQSTFPLLFHF